MNIPRVMLAASASGSGKTTVTCGLLQALKNRGSIAVSCKCGPDYIDPMFHETVLHVPSENLDLFFCEEEVVRGLFAKHAQGADISVIEGVMGYYDGRALDSFQGSAYDIARVTQTPVILVVPCKGAALSLVPVIQGMIEFREDSNIAGIILNGVSKGLYPRMKEMLEGELFIPVLGYVPQLSFWNLESRHLGLITPQETPDLEEQIVCLGRILEQTLDIDKLNDIANQAPDYAISGILPTPQMSGGHTVRIAVAKDESFCFYYRANLEFLEQHGCELVFFSPLHDEGLPSNVDGLILGGGYPEVYAQSLSGNRNMIADIQKAVVNGLPCIAECGGFLYLHEELEGTDGMVYPMVGVVQGRSFRTSGLVRFGYATLEMRLERNAFLNKGEKLKVHEFHYWDSTNTGHACLAVKPDGKRSWECIHADGRLFAGFPHIHFYSNLEFAQRFINMCREGEK